ncbi:MAG: proton-conducting transporter membrane subunit [Phycisphaerales bacterium]
MQRYDLALLVIAIFAPALAGLATLILPRNQRGLRVAVGFGGLAAAVGAMATFIASPQFFNPEHVVDAVSLVPSVGMELSFITDGLSVFFALLISGIGCLIALYARAYFGKDNDSLFKFYPLLGLFATAMMGVVLSDNIVSLFMFWELTSISSFLLIGWNRSDPKAVRLAMQALLTTGLGGMALLGGLVLLVLATVGADGAWTITAVTQAFEAGTFADSTMIGWAFALIFLGAGAKSAQWPLHFWLPGAMAAPTPVSAYLHSATMVKAGVYLFGRLYPALHGIAWWAPVLITFGAVTMLLGAFLALRSTELKKIFAYTTVSQLGLLTCMYGLGGYQYHGHENLIWPVTQILNHALYKAPLFIIAGAIMHATGKKYLPDVKGLWHTHKVLALTCILAAYALAGGPLTLSFTAKEAFLYQIYHALESEPRMLVIGAMAVLTAACNVAIFWRITTTFLAKPEHDAHAHDTHAGHHEHERGFWGATIWWPALFIVAWQYVGGIGTAFFGGLVQPIETHTGYWEHLEKGSFFATLAHPGSVPFLMSLAAIALGTVLGLSKLWRTPVVDFHNTLFPSTFNTTETAGFRLFNWFQSGNLRAYVAIVLAALFLGVFAADAIAWVGGNALELPPLGSMTNMASGFLVMAVFLTVIICGTAIILPVVDSRIVRVLILGACGFSVTGMYLIWQAPDLALTQLMFEIISVVLFLLVLRLLPDEPKKTRHIARLPRALGGLAVGVAIGWIVLQAASVADLRNYDTYKNLADANGAETHLVAAPAPGEDHADDAHAGEVHAGPAVVDNGALGGWFLRHSYAGSEESGGRGGGGNNAVNVILVDFRGYDTIGEITVLAITAIGVLAMLSAVPVALTQRGHRLDLVTGPQPQLRSSLMRTSMKLILPLSFIFAGYVFFKGHNEPGGGFIAGLIASVGLAVYRMSEGVHALRRLLPIKPSSTAAIGLAIALITAMFPMIFGLISNGEAYAFLTSGNWYIPLPGESKTTFHLTSVMFFDLGVFIVVVGVAVGIINRFEEELES